MTQTQQVVVHFFHREFTRCKIVDKHLSELMRKFFKTRFIKMSAPVRWRSTHQGPAALTPSRFDSSE